LALTADTVVRLLIAERAKILAYIGALVRDRAMAEDVFQEVSMLAVQRCGEIGDETHLAGWLRRTARFKALRAEEQRRRRAARLADDVMDLLEPEWQAFDPLPARDLVAALEGCLQRLTPNARALVELKYVEGLEGARIAERLDQQLRSIYTALSRIHRALGDCIRRRFFAEAQTGDA